MFLFVEIWHAISLQIKKNAQKKNPESKKMIRDFLFFIQFN